MSTPLKILQKAAKQLKQFDRRERQAFERALAKFESADPLTQRMLLSQIANTHFAPFGVRWSIRASRKHRVLLDWEDNGYVVRAFVSRGDHRYYSSE